MATITGLDELQAALDAESYHWLQDANDDIARALEVVVKRGATAEDVRRFVNGYTARDKLAKRLEQAARHLKREAA
jgi:hypothetical protein